MQTENLTVHKCCQWKVVKEVSEIFPNIGVSIFSQAFVIKSINLGNLPTFVISSKNGDSGAKSDLERDKEGDSLHAVVASVHVVAHEQVVGVGGLASNLE